MPPQPIAIATPGEILLEEFLKPMNIPVETFADQIGHDRDLIGRFVKGISGGAKTDHGSAGIVPVRAA